MNDFNKRLQKALQLRNLSQSELCKKTGIPKSAMSQYVSGDFIPKRERTYVIAQALNISEGWLMGYDVPMEREKKSTITIDIDTYEANKKLDELIEKANQLKAILAECGITADKL